MCNDCKSGTVPRRMWINQPSKLQDDNALHGTNVLAYHEYGSTYRVFFLNGDIVDQQMLRSQLSEGWQPMSCELLEALEQLTQAVEHTPLGVRGIKAVQNANAVIAKVRKARGG